MIAARRLAATLAADVVGHSRLMGEERRTARSVGERREVARPPLKTGRLNEVKAATKDGKAKTA
jgi:hypothetical protein